MKETRTNTNKTTRWFLEKINKIEKLLPRSIMKKKGEKTQINKTRNEKGKFPTDNTEIRRLMRDDYEQLYAIKMDNLEEMDKFLEKYSLQN